MAGTQLRHPHVLQFKDSVEVDGDKPGSVTLYLVTEPVQPLSTVLQELRLDGAQRCALGVCAALVRRLTPPIRRPQGRLHCSWSEPGGASGSVPERRLQNGAQQLRVQTARAGP